MTDIATALRTLSETVDGSDELATGASVRAHGILRAAILREALPAGTLLKEEDLAQALDISRTPVRSALQMLFQEGLVEIGPRRQLYVRDFAPAERSEVMMLRVALERVAVATACKAIDVAKIDDLRITLIRQRRAAGMGDTEAFIDLDDQFHLGIAMGAGLPTLRGFLGQLRAFVRMMGLLAIKHEGRMNEVIEEHERIVEALEARDEQAALEALDQHLAKTYALLDEFEAPTRLLDLDPRATTST